MTNRDLTAVAVGLTLLTLAGLVQSYRAEQAEDRAQALQMLFDRQTAAINGLLAADARLKHESDALMATCVAAGLAPVSANRQTSAPDR